MCFTNVNFYSLLYLKLASQWPQIKLRFLESDFSETFSSSRSFYPAPCCWNWRHHFPWRDWSRTLHWFQPVHGKMPGTFPILKRPSSETKVTWRNAWFAGPSEHLSVLVWERPVDSMKVQRGYSLWCYCNLSRFYVVCVVVLIAPYTATTFSTAKCGSKNTACNCFRNYNWL